MALWLTQSMAMLVTLLEQPLDRQPPTVVTLATTWWETILAHVKLQKFGLGVNLRVNVCYYPACVGPKIWLLLWGTRPLHVCICLRSKCLKVHSKLRILSPLLIVPPNHPLSPYHYCWMCHGVYSFKLHLKLKQYQHSIYMISNMYQVTYLFMMYSSL